MCAGATNNRSYEHHTDPGGTPGERGVFPFLRHTHIFAATVRQSLQLELLRDATPHPLTLSQFHVLKLMCVNGKHQVGQMAGFLGVSAPAATKNIDKLERLGLIARSRSEGDRRTTLLNVSPAGRELVERYERLETARLEAALAGFEPEEVEAFSRLLERFSVSLIKQEPARDGACLRCSAYIEVGCPVGIARGGCPYQELRGLRRRKGADGDAS